ncbi:cyclopropane-fatty-acyl-phospholipid synthase family protein [Photobacterium sp. CCB-ST2H9]|uniref:SAM-dependent methyltransferase n=1 Tax=Photobacterium sp. CCB-ST2H9 TaxID=2912855 RepID=UPI0020058BDF|nr:cyclopropane-fatty-acyl-phospholipid synthase family protein [Photobacterium sp. CCB-ST2H9]UTM60169.1 cyclopropane-fatty-acyl-phospholipid synthase family protein [Photobacterium sp. CCB-ST2H9]
MSNTETKSRYSTKPEAGSVARTLVFTLLKQLRYAGLTLVDSRGDTHRFGDETADCQAYVLVKDPALYRRLLQGGSIAAGEAYMDGWWDSPDITAVVQVLARNLAMLDTLEAKTSWLTRIREHWLHLNRQNDKAGSKKNILAHYDLGNDFYRTFLDPQMLYSCAIYDSESASLTQAQFNKMDRLCRQLELKPSDHLLEIGTGWGAMAIHAAKHYGCRVTTTTISDAQYEYAKVRVEQEGLADRITLLRQDYRELTGQYDKLVSVEMIEAVGKAYLATYIRKCQSLLKAGGLFAIQAITIADQRFESYSKGVDFIQKHIFPGGFLPSVTHLAQSLTQYSDFVLRDLKDIGLDYARTLADWHQLFNASTEKLIKQGFDQRFIRMWRYYLCYCEGGFREQTISTVQVLASRPRWGA